jgi:hypothetical protein
MSRRSPESPYSKMPNRYYGGNARLLFNQRCQTIHQQSKILSQKDSASVIYFADKHKDEDDLKKISRYISGDDKNSDTNLSKSWPSTNSPSRDSSYCSDDSTSLSPRKYGLTKLKSIPLLKLPRDVLSRSGYDSSDSESELLEEIAKSGYDSSIVAQPLTPRFGYDIYIYV